MRFVEFGRGMCFLEVAVEEYICFVFWIFLGGCRIYEEWLFWVVVIKCGRGFIF